MPRQGQALLPVLPVLFVLLVGCKPSEKMEVEISSPGADFTLIGQAGGNPLKGSRSQDSRKAIVTIEWPDDPLRAPDTSVFLTIDVVGNAVIANGTGSLWTTVTGPAPGTKTAQGGGKVISEIFTCPARPQPCTTTYEVAMRLTGAAAGAEGTVKWNVIGHASIYGKATQPPKAPIVRIVLTPPSPT